MRQDEMLLRDAVEALRADKPKEAQIAASAKLVAQRLGMDGVGEGAVVRIDGCDDVRHSLNDYRSHTLSSARVQLIDAHLHDCSACRRYFRGESGAAVLDWTAPKATRGFAWHPQAAGWALAASLLVLTSSFFLYKAYWQVPPGVRAEVQSIDGSAYLISDTGGRALVAGDELKEGEHLRTSGGAHAVLRLTDGSTVEMNERSVLGLGARGHNMTVTLDDGAVIVQAAKRQSGHLYVKTPDCRVAVTGTIFSVDSGMKGSRVAVLQGTVHVLHAGMDTAVQAGDQVTTSDNLSPAPVEQQIAWSHDREKYLPLLAALSTLQHRIEQIPLPQLRYTSDLLGRIPADTLLFVSIPNLGDFLNEANQTFHEQLKQSPELQEWWNRGHAQNTEELDSLVGKIHQASQYLGDEIVIVGVKQASNPGFSIIADVKKGGLDDFLRSQFPSSNLKAGLTIFDQSSLDAARVSPKAEAGGYGFIGKNQVIFSNSLATLKQVNAQLNAGASGFTTTDFGQQISSAYSRGAGMILAADIHQMIVEKDIRSSAGGHGREIANSGLEDMRYLIAEHRERNGQPENRVNLQFSGTRQGVASWLAAPAPIGSLEFITPNAAVAVALLSKDPKAIADDIMNIAIPDEAEQKKAWTEAETKLQINLREDLAATLGGDFLVSLDGPVLPTPSWKAVIEVRDPVRLEQTMERLTESIRSLARGNQAQGKQGHSISIVSSDANGQRFYALHDSTTGNDVAQYTFANGYMIVAPSRALLMESMHTYATGDSLAHSAAFRALLPKDENENYSAVAYQNLTPVLTPLLSQFTGKSADALRQLAADARPTAICARGEESRIEAASDSHLFGFDFLTLETLLHAGNKQADVSVRE